MLIDSSKSTPQKIFDFLHAHILIIIVAIVIISSILSMVAIMTKEEVKENNVNTNIKYEDTNLLYLSMDNVSSLDPLFSNDLDTYYISQIVYNGLFKLGDDLNVEPDLVKKYKTHGSEGSVDIKLRKAEFSDGSQLSSYDVLFTVNTIKNIGSKSPYFSYVDKIDYVIVNDSRNLTVVFKDKRDAALDNLVFPIVSSDSYETGKNDIPGTGPFKYYKYRKQRTLTLVPNKHYFGEEAKGKIIFKYIKNKEASSNLITADLITAYMNTAADSDVDAEDKGLNYIPVVSSEVEYLGFNFENKYLKDKNIRRSIALAIDAQNLINENYGGTAVLSDSIYFPGFLGTSGKGERYIVDQHQAADLLSQAGLANVDVDGFLVDKKNKIVEFDLLVNEDNRSRTDSAYTIAEDLQKVGIKINVVSLNREKYLKALKNRKYDLYLDGYMFDKQYNLKKLFNEKTLKGFDNKKLYKYVCKLETTLSAERQAEIFGELDRLMEEEIPYYSLCYKTYGFETVEHFECETAPTFFNFFRDCDKWAWKKAVNSEEKEDK